MFALLSNFVLYFKETVSAIWTFLQSLINGLIQIFKVLPQAEQMLIQSIGYLPSTLAVFATLSITVSIIYLIVNRQTGG